MVDFDTLEENVDMDGKPYWAVSGAMKKDALFGGKENQMSKVMGSMASRVRVIFTKDSDLFSGVEFINAEGKPAVAMHYKNVNFEPKFDDKTFAYEPPANVKVQNFADMMRNVGQAMGGDEDDEGDEDEAPAKPASKPAGGK
jgi:hypothetical protein